MFSFLALSREKGTTEHLEEFAPERLADVLRKLVEETRNLLTFDRLHA